MVFRIIALKVALCLLKFTIINIRDIKIVCVVAYEMQQEEW